MKSAPKKETSTPKLQANSGKGKGKGKGEGRDKGNAKPVSGVKIPQGKRA